MSFRNHQPTRLVVAHPNDEPWQADAQLWPPQDTSPSCFQGPASNISWRSEHSMSLERATTWREDTVAQLNEQSQEWKLSSREEAAVRRASISYVAAHSDEEEGEKWSCKACTYENFPGIMNCIICGTQRDSVYSPSNAERQYRILRQDLKYKWKGKLVSKDDGCCHSYDRNTRKKRVDYAQFCHACCCYPCFQGQDAEYLNPKKGCRFAERYFSGWAMIHCPHCCFSCCFPCVHGCFLRRAIRHKFEIKGRMFDDCKVHCFCWACAAIQERKQLELEWKPPELGDDNDDDAPPPKPCENCCTGPKAACKTVYDLLCNWSDDIMEHRSDSDGSDDGWQDASPREDPVDVAKRQAFLAQYNRRRGSAWVAGSPAPNRQRTNSGGGSAGNSPTKSPNGSASVAVASDEAPQPHTFAGRSRPPGFVPTSSEMTR